MDAGTPPPRYQWTPPTPEERAAELRRAEQETRFVELKLYGVALLQCFASTLVGCVVAGFAFATTDLELGRILLPLGMIISWSGNLFALGRLAIRIDRGEY